MTCCLCAYLVVLDGEEHESLCVLLQNRLNHLASLWLFNLWLGLVVHGDSLDRDGDLIVGNLFADDVLFVLGGEDGLLDGRLYREALNGFGSLHRRVSGCFKLFASDKERVPSLTASPVVRTWLCEYVMKYVQSI